MNVSEFLRVGSDEKELDESIENYTTVDKVFNSFVAKHPRAQFYKGEESTSFSEELKKHRDKKQQAGMRLTKAIKSAVGRGVYVRPLLSKLPYSVREHYGQVERDIRREVGSGSSSAPPAKEPEPQKPTTSGPEKPSSSKSKTTKGSKRSPVQGALEFIQTLATKRYKLNPGQKPAVLRIFKALQKLAGGGSKREGSVSEMLTEARAKMTKPMKKGKGTNKPVGTGILMGQLTMQMRRLMAMIKKGQVDKKWLKATKQAIKVLEAGKKQLSADSKKFTARNKDRK